MGVRLIQVSLYLFTNVTIVLQISMNVVFRRSCVVMAPVLTLPAVFAVTASPDLRMLQ